jgi:hypothetical protein
MSTPRAIAARIVKHRPHDECTRTLCAVQLMEASRPNRSPAEKRDDDEAVATAIGYALRDSQGKLTYEQRHARNVALWRPEYAARLAEMQVQFCAALRAARLAPTRADFVGAFRDACMADAAAWDAIGKEALASSAPAAASVAEGDAP